MPCWYNPISRPLLKCSVKMKKSVENTSNFLFKNTTHKSIVLDNSYNLNLMRMSYIFGIVTQVF